MKYYVATEELRNAIKRSRSHKAAGEDQIPVDLIKHITPEYEKELLALINKMYRETNYRKISALPKHAQSAGLSH
jgi:uncharacterized membrane protein YheB (UPF0754 family)